MRRRALAAGIALTVGALVVSDALAEENVAEVVAVHVREQGHACDKAESAKRDENASRPGEAAWILTCSNAVYRVRLIPDMSAKIEKVE